MPNSPVVVVGKNVDGLLERAAQEILPDHLEERLHGLDDFDLDVSDVRAQDVHCNGEELAFCLLLLEEVCQNGHCLRQSDLDLAGGVVREGSQMGHHVLGQFSLAQGGCQVLEGFYSRAPHFCLVVLQEVCVQLYCT